MTDNELDGRIAKDPDAYFTRELTVLACESVKRDSALAKLEAEVIASRDIVRKAVARAEELERLVRAYLETVRKRDDLLAKLGDDAADSTKFGKAIKERWAALIAMSAAVSNGESK